MDDSSLDHYTFTEEEQTHATRIYQQMARHQISKRRPTYIDLTVGLDGHGAAVQITITPSLHPLPPRQTNISIHYRYGLCCRSISREVARERIGQTVRGVVGVYFQLFEWDSSEEDCYTGDLATSSHVPNHSCSSAAQAILSDYIASTTGEPNASVERRIAPNASVERRPAPNAEGKRRRLNTTASRSDLSDEDIARRLARKTVKGLSQCRRQPRPNLQLNILDMFRSLDMGSGGSYAHYATKLVEVADKLEIQAQTQRAGSWYMRILASCVTIASPSLPALPAETSSGDSPKDRLWIARQESVARIVNMIVNGLWNDWGEKAFLVYRAFAELNYKFHIIQSLGVDRLSTIAQNTVEKLKKEEVPSFSSKEDLFDPSWMLCQFLKSDNYQGVCNALKLPYLRNTDDYSLPSSHYLSTVLGRRANSSPLQLSLPGHTTDELMGYRPQDIHAAGLQAAPLPSYDSREMTCQVLDREASDPEPREHHECQAANPRNPEALPLDVSTPAQHQHHPELNSQAHASIPDDMPSPTQYYDGSTPSSGEPYNIFDFAQLQHYQEPDPQVQANPSQMDHGTTSPTQYYGGSTPSSGEPYNIFNFAQLQHYQDLGPRVQANTPQMNHGASSPTEYHDGSTPFHGEPYNVFISAQLEHYPVPGPPVQANTSQIGHGTSSPTQYNDSRTPSPGEPCNVFDFAQLQHRPEPDSQVQASIPRIGHDTSSSIQQFDDRGTNSQSSEIQASDSESMPFLSTGNLNSASPMMVW